MSTEQLYRHFEMRRCEARHSDALFLTYTTLSVETSTGEWFKTVYALCGDTGVFQDALFNNSSGKLTFSREATIQVEGEEFAGYIYNFASARRTGSVFFSKTPLQPEYGAHFFVVGAPDSGGGPLPDYDYWDKGCTAIRTEP